MCYDCEEDILAPQGGIHVPLTEGLLRHCCRQQCWRHGSLTALPTMKRTLNRLVSGTLSHLGRYSSPLGYVSTQNCVTLAIYFHLCTHGGIQDNFP